jgi:hypothetical protein
VLLTTARRDRFPVFVIDPWERCPPEEDSVGTNPK